MNYHLLLLIYLALFLGEFLLQWVLDILNINSMLKNRKTVPLEFRESIDNETYSKSIDYSLRKAKLGLTDSVINRLIIIAVLFSGAAGLLDSYVSGLNLSAFLTAFLFLIAAGAVLSMLQIPMSLYSVFVLEEEFDFNTQTARTYFMDLLKQIPMGAIILVLLLGAIFAARTLFGTWWWLAGWGLWSMIQLILMLIYPLFIAPLFNKFTPIEEGKLKTRLEKLAEKTSFPNSGIYIMDGSRRSRHSNAYFTGFGKSRRIVIYDTLIKSLSDEELEAVLAHEIGHWKHGHVLRMLIVSLASSLVMFFVFDALLKQDAFFAAFGFSSVSIHSLLFISSFYIAPLMSMFAPVFNLGSRKHEYQADKFAFFSTGGKSAPLINALITLSKDNLSNLTPHPAYSFWHYSHPVLTERIAALRSLSTEISAEKGN
jgi:STE24 endopeptidase